MSFWQPRSVLQLVLVGFFAALAPLVVAIFFTVQTLEELATSDRDITRQVIDVTRLGQAIQGDLPEMERHARQYLALSDPELAALFQTERLTLLQKLRDLQERMAQQSPDVTALLYAIEQLDPVLAPPPDEGDVAESVTGPVERLDQAFAVITEHRRAVQQWLQASVDRLLEKNAAQAEVIIDALVLQLSFLAFATLALLVFFSYWINKPVQDLTKEIDRLGTSGLSRTIEISGPKEVEDLGRKLEWLRKSLHENDQQKEQFLRHISHELKTPLSSLREGADLLAEQVTGRLSQQQHEVVDIVRHNAIELQRLIENLLDYNQLPRQELLFEDVDLAQLMEELLANYRISIDQKALHLVTQGSVELWVVDRYKLKTTLDNLLSNAINYTPEGGIIDITWRAEAANLVIEVANSGKSIPKKDAERVFEPFFQSSAKRTGPIKGSGIGLSVARECIEAQGGSLTLVPHTILPICFRLICPAH